MHVRGLLSNSKPPLERRGLVHNGGAHSQAAPEIVKSHEVRVDMRLPATFRGKPAEAQIRHDVFDGVAGTNW
jgi:hypothetical protein